MSRRNAYYLFYQNPPTWPSLLNNSWDLKTVFTESDHRPTQSIGCNIREEEAAEKMLYHFVLFKKFLNTPIYKGMKEMLSQEEWTSKILLRY